MVTSEIILLFDNAGICPKKATRTRQADQTIDYQSDSSDTRLSDRECHRKCPIPHKMKCTYANNSKSLSFSLKWS